MRVQRMRDAFGVLTGLSRYLIQSSIVGIIASQGGVFVGMVLPGAL